MTRTHTQIATLSGADHPQMNHVAVTTVGAAALATSCGRLPKQRPGIDPNEDAALVAVGPAGVFAAVMDGHFGYNAAAATLDAAREWAPDLVEQPVEDPRRLLNAVLKSAQQRLGERLPETDPDRRRSRTAVTLAVVDRRKVHVVIVGDTLALLARRGRGKWVRFRGSGEFMGPESLMARVQEAKRSPGDRLVLASDGLADFTAPSFLIDTLTRPDVANASTAVAARALVDGALLGGAGDNVTVVCIDL